MTEIIPAILPTTFSDLVEKVSRVRGGVEVVQLDVCDGKFVPNQSWPHGKHDDNFERILAEEDGLPAWEEIDYEIDLMVSDPEAAIAGWVTAGAKRIVIHYESVKDFKSLLANVRKEYGYSRDSLAPDFGVALNVDTPLESIEEFLPELDFVQLMGIAKIGFQGKPFDARTVERVRALKKLHPELLVSVDGGVNLGTAPLLIEASADRLIVGSAILHADNPFEALRELEALS